MYRLDMATAKDRVKDAILESVLDGFSDDLFDTKDKVQKQTLSIWVPSDYKKKYDQLQAMSRCKFGKRLQIIIMRAMDMAEKQVETPPTFNDSIQP